MLMPTILRIQRCFCSNVNSVQELRHCVIKAMAVKPGNYDVLHFLWYFRTVSFIDLILF